MSSSNYYRSWIDRPHLDPNTRLLTEEYQRGITEFMGLVQRQPEAETGMLRCPCSNCKNRKIIKEWDVWTHLYLNGFTRSYKIWYHHGETDYEYGSTSEPQPAVRLEEPIRMDVDYGVGTEQMGISPRNIPRKNIPTDTLPRNILTAKISRNIPTAEVRRNIPIPLFSRNVSEDRSIGNIRGDTDEQS
ncbi:hypothetical protein F2Q68_00021537 [Brassica cretica]|uniref:Transposase-associated domain-containing protein n=1 Tax=Brassica cretica TaxID=69181 RepID=A0A8S9G5M0_BRACR|nr:hypothetical protein F2Q68_00021537 [Brassica cretica]